MTSFRGISLKNFQAIVAQSFPQDLKIQDLAHNVDVSVEDQPLSKIFFEMHGTCTCIYMLHICEPPPPIPPDLHPPPPPPHPT